MKKVTITSNNITHKQWSSLLLELNLIRRAWKPYAILKIDAPGINKIVTSGTTKYGGKYGEK